MEVPWNPLWVLWRKGGIQMWELRRAWVNVARSPYQSKLVESQLRPSCDLQLCTLKMQPCQEQVIYHQQYLVRIKVQTKQREKAEFLGERKDQHVFNRLVLNEIASSNRDLCYCASVLCSWQIVGGIVGERLGEERALPMGEMWGWARWLLGHFQLLIYARSRLRLCETIHSFCTQGSYRNLALPYLVAVRKLFPWMSFLMQRPGFCT